VDLILKKLAARQSTEKLLRAYPQLNETQIFACLAFAADKIKNEIVYKRAA